MAWCDTPGLRAGCVEGVGATHGDTTCDAATPRRIWKLRHSTKPKPRTLVIPAQAGIQWRDGLYKRDRYWIPAWAGMTNKALYASRCFSSALLLPLLLRTGSPLLFGAPRR
jgi:hypothetical protein